MKKYIQAAQSASGKHSGTDEVQTRTAVLEVRGHQRQ